MLTRNVYLIYPPGYSGSYVSWAINISDLDRRDSTVPCPINRHADTQLGGAGTAHLHTRIPTHQGFDRHFIWAMYNRPTEPRIYIINPSNEWTQGRGAVTVARSDPNGVFINIHHEEEFAVEAYAEINCVTKWPTFMSVRVADEYLTCPRKSWNMHSDYNPYDCAQDQKFRNFSVEVRNFYMHNSPVTSQQLALEIEKSDIWYQVRNRYQPHEINEETYLPHVDLTNRFFNVSCRDIASDRFPDILSNILAQSGITDNYDLDYVKSFHHNYVQAQQNLHWFHSYQAWQDTGKIDDYIRSHSIIEAQIIREIFRASNRYFLTEADRDYCTSFWARLRGPDWPDLITDEHQFYDLPGWLQEEIRGLNYAFRVKAKPNRDILKLDWESMSIDEINQVYQHSRCRK